MIGMALSLMRCKMFTRSQSNAALAIVVLRRALTRGLAIALLVSAGGCGKPAQPTHIDLLSLLARAEKRPPVTGEDAFVVGDIQFDGRVIPAVIVPQPSRIVWTVRIPRRATLTGHAGLAPDRTGKYAGDAVFRIGVSGGRIYEQVFERRMTPVEVESDRTFVPIAVDLSAWAGWQWSLFYRPSESTWNLVFSVDGARTTDTPLWLAPAINGVK